MKLAVQRTTTAVAAFATAGISGLVWGAAPAFATPNPCGTGTLISGNICEQTFTSTTATDFTPPTKTTKLEALLVGGGGAGNVEAASAPTTSGYAVAGGGGQVKIVNFTSRVGSATPLVVKVGAGGVAGSNGGATTVTGGPLASAGGGDEGSETTGGSSGTNTGASISDSGTPPTYYGGGAGAGPTGSTATINGGAGLTVSTSFSSDALFGTDSACYGGGGATLEGSAVGIPGCGGNGPGSDPAATSYPAVNANTGGGGAASLAVGSAGDGSAGIVVFRWFAPPALAETGGGPNAAELPIAIGTLAVGTGLLGTVLYRRRRKAI